jgi:hypothetical protein
MKIDVVLRREPQVTPATSPSREVPALSPAAEILELNSDRVRRLNILLNRASDRFDL